MPKNSTSSRPQPARQELSQELTVPQVQTLELVLQMQQGLNVAVVTDAGTPGISDPG